MNNSYFEILRPGINTTIQDKGRNHLYHIGIAVSGAIDQRNYKLANSLVGNQLDEAAIEFVKNVHLPKEATSLGGLESLVSLPFNTSQASLTKAQRRDIGINDGLIRLSVGLEEINDIIKDIDQAF